MCLVSLWEKGNLDTSQGECHMKTQRHKTQREDGHAKTEAEIGVMVP